MVKMVFLGLLSIRILSRIIWQRDVVFCNTRERFGSKKLLGVLVVRFGKHIWKNNVVKLLLNNSISLMVVMLCVIVGDRLPHPLDGFRLFYALEW